MAMTFGRNVSKGVKASATVAKAGAVTLAGGAVAAITCLVHWDDITGDDESTVVLANQQDEEDDDDVEELSVEQEGVEGSLNRWSLQELERYAWEEFVKSDDLEFTRDALKSEVGWRVRRLLKINGAYGQWSAFKASDTFKDSAALPQLTDALESEGDFEHLTPAQRQHFAEGWWRQKVQGLGPATEKLIRDNFVDVAEDYDSLKAELRLFSDVDGAPYVYWGKLLWLDDICEDNIEKADVDDWINVYTKDSTLVNFNTLKMSAPDEEYMRNRWQAHKHFHDIADQSGDRELQEWITTFVQYRATLPVTRGQHLLDRTSVENISLAVLLKYVSDMLSDMNYAELESELSYSSLNDYQKQCVKDHWSTLNHEEE